MESQEYIRQWVSNFIKKYFKQIDLKKCEWDVRNMKGALNDIETKDYMAGWVIGEVMVWGMLDGQDWVKKLNLYIEHEEFLVELGDRYFMFDGNIKSHMFKEVYPHIKTVVYFDDNKDKT